MEDMKKEHPQGCECSMCKGGVCFRHPMCGHGCGHGCGCGHRVARLILGILLIVFIFCAGFWFGNMSAIFHSSSYGDGYGYRMMRGYDRSMMQYDQNYNGGQQGSVMMNKSTSTSPAQ